MIRTTPVIALLALAACAGPDPTPVAWPTVPATPPPATASTPASTPPLTTAAEPSRDDDRRPARVVRVVDGDTIVLSGIAIGEPDRAGGRKARLIGIDTPEVYGGVECMGREASAYTRQRLDGRDVLVAFDVDPLDRYGRALVYVWEADGGFFNERIVADGFAQPMTVPPNVRYAETFVRAARTAREQGRGLWSRC